MTEKLSDILVRLEKAQREAQEYREQLIATLETGLAHLLGEIGESEDEASWRASLISSAKEDQDERL